MKRLVLVASLVVALVGIGGCDDTDAVTPPGGADAAVDAPAGGDAADAAAGNPMCRGRFAGLSRNQLAAAAGRCTATASDLDYICTGDIETRAADCASACLTGSRDPANCVGVCLQQNQTLTVGCADCYEQWFACSITACFACLADQKSDGCRSCQLSNCDPAFFTCTGLRGPAVVPDAGADAAADAPADAPRPDAGADAADAGADAGDAGGGAGDAGADAAADAPDAG